MAGLTRSGEAKIVRALKRARLAAKEALEHNVGTVLIPAIVKRAPNMKQEEEILVRGEGGTFGYRYTTGGADSYIEELRMPLQRAIVRDFRAGMIGGYLVDVSEDRITIKVGRTWVINELTKIYWQVTGGHGGIRETYPYKEGGTGAPNYVQAIEFGGAWQVLPRGDYPLRPDPDITTEKIHKTVNPWRMYGGAIRDQAVRRRMIANIRRYVKGEVQFEGMR